MDAEKYWNERAKKLRRFMGFCPLTPEEASEALNKVPKRKASAKEIDSIIESVTRGEIPEAEEYPQPDWSPDFDYAEMDREAALCRNQGDQNPESDPLEEELLEELLKDDDAEKDQNGVGG